MPYLDKAGLTHLWGKIKELLGNKVDKVSGKSLSTNDFTDTEQSKLDATNVAYGTCTTAAATAAKVITISGNTNWKLAAGSIIVIKFSYTNSADNPTFNVNSTGAKSVLYGTAVITTSSLSYAGYASRYGIYAYDGTRYVFVGWSYDANSTYSNASLGQGYGTCATAAATTAKVVTLSSYSLTKGGVVSVKFTYAVPASATMNINSKGAKAIYYRGAAITAGIIDAGDVATFIYDGTQYHLLTVDRHRFFSLLVPYGTAIPEDANLNTSTYMKVGNYYCSSNAIAKTLTNSPTTSAFMLTVYSPLSTTIDNETTKTWIYRLRKLQVYTGDEFVQYCYVGETAGTWTYGDWKKVIKSDNTATTSAAGLMSAADKTKLNGIATGANAYSHPAGSGASKSSGLYKFTTDSTSHISGVTAVTKADITALGIPAQDTVYELPTASSTLGGVKTTSTVTSTSGLTACPIISGVPYYKDTNTNTNYYHTPAFTSGTKIGTGSGVADMYVPAASATQAGTTIVYPAAQCTSYTSDSGTVTPAAVKKAVGLFALSNEGGTVSGNVTFSNSATAQSGQPHIKWATVNSKTPYIGFAQDQNDGTFILGSLGGVNYATGLAIGGGSGNLLWKGTKVATASDLPSNATTSKAGLMSAADKTKLNGLKNSVTHSVSLTASGWTQQSNGTHTQTATISGLTASDKAIVDIDMSEATTSTYHNYLEAWNFVCRAYTVANGVTFVCYAGAPAMTISVNVEVL